MAKRIKEKAALRAANKDKRPCAHVRYVRLSPSKVRIVLDIVRGLPYAQAVAVLENTPKAASPIVKKLIESAGANAEHNLQLSKSDLYVAEIFACDGPTLKRVMPRARGSAARILKRTSHITVKLDTKQK